MPAGIPLDHFHRWGCDGKRLLHGISIDCNKKVSGFARGSSAVPLGEGKASSPSQSNPSDLPAPPKGGASDASARLAFYLETAPILQKAPPSGELANECEPERVQHAESKRKSLFHSAALSQKAALYGCPPHGGFGLGIDRLTMLLCGLSIKDAEFLFRGPNRLTP